MRQVTVPLRAVGLALALTAGVPLRGIQPIRGVAAHRRPGEADVRAITAAVDKRLRRQARARLAA